MLPIYVRREPTGDPLSLAHGCAHKRDTVFYRDPQGKEVLARKPWYQSGHPRRNSKQVTLNCYRWALQWL